MTHELYGLFTIIVLSMNYNHTENKTSKVQMNDEAQSISILIHTNSEMIKETYGRNFK